MIWDEGVYCDAFILNEVFYYNQAQYKVIDSKSIGAVDDIITLLV
jgi:hypothetical protein